MKSFINKAGSITRVALTAIGATASLTAGAQQLFTTEDDWSGWTSVSAGSVAYTYTATGAAGSGINGLGNTGQFVSPNAGGAGQAGTPGALGIVNSSLGWNVAQSQNEQNNAGLIAALWAGNEIQVTYTLTQTMATGASGYWQLVPIFNNSQGYTELNNAGFFTSSTLSAGTYTATYDYTPSASFLPTASGQDSYFQFLISANSGGSLVNGTQQWYLDDIEVVSTPEPATLSLCGLGLASGLMFLRRRKA